MSYVKMEQTVTQYTDFNEWVDIGGRHFKAYIRQNRFSGDALAMSGGRILELYIFDENGDQVAVWKDREWLVKVPDFDGEAFIAASYFINRYNRVMDEQTERGYLIHG